MKLHQDILQVGIVDIIKIDVGVIMDVINYKSLLETINSFSKIHPEINTVLFNEYNFTSRTDIKYPVLAVFNTGSTLTNNINTHSFTFIWADRLLRDGNNWIDVQSNGYRIVPEIVNYLYNKIGISDEYNITVNSFKDQYADYLAGVSVSIDIDTISETDYCFNLCNNCEDECI